MKLKKQPNNVSCLITSFSMLLDISVEEAIKIVGCDGMEIINPDLTEPFRGHHIQEMIDLCERYGYSVTEIQARPSLYNGILKSGFPIFDNDTEINRITNYLEKYSGVLTVTIKSLQKRHAVVWNHETHEIFDPNGIIYEPKKDYFIIESFYIIIKKQ